MDAAPAEPELTIDHPRFQRVWTAIFTRTVVGDCMDHLCEMQDTHTRKLDACCQYGCDVDLYERDAIVAREHLIRPLLRDDARTQALFDDEVDDDPDYPSGHMVRTAVHDGGCIFLAHDRRGCAIHRASLEQGWDFNGVKPAICRLFPLTYEGNAIVIADELPEYSCAHVPGISIYRAARQALHDAFGEPLVTALDEAEKSVLAGQPRRLPIA